MPSDLESSDSSQSPAELAWFDALYASADGDASQIPWAKRKPNPFLSAWLERERPITRGRTAIVVGCGLGDDAELLARWGYATTAFDLSPAAIAWCRQRFPSTRVTYQQADLLNIPADWRGAWDFVFEAYTLQAVPPELRPQLTAAVATLPKPGGRLLTIARGREPDEPLGDAPPFPLTRDQLGELTAGGTLRLEGFEELWDESGGSPVRRFRAAFVRDA